MKKVAIVIGGIVVVLFLAVLLMPALCWDGAVPVQFHFCVIENGTPRAIKNARIRVVRNSQLRDLSDTNLAEMLPVVTTDEGGLATVLVMCGAGGSKGPLGKTGRFGISHELHVEADGYRPMTTALANVVGGSRWPLSKRAFDVQLILFKNP